MAWKLDWYHVILFRIRVDFHYHLGEICFISPNCLSCLRNPIAISEKLQMSPSSWRDLFYLVENSFISAWPRLSRRSIFHLVPISETLQISPSSWRDLGDISFISPRPQRLYQSCRVIGDISAKSRLSRRDLRGITNLAEFLTRSRRDLVYLAAISDTRSRKRWYFCTASGGTSKNLELKGKFLKYLHQLS